jgi:hypothetical protein
MYSVAQDLIKLGIRFRHEIDCVFAEMPYDQAWELFAQDYIINQISHDVVCIEEI